ncbi:transcription factor GTE9-like [Macadamia integrifolia]|uniref:transcription factor GTE9-like n=1 Tax=Macadamia integrifolia TaxID=60698 RepID=UPI001C4F8912|nr:transcription factor GTE9-like [Macadamia integrifolia]
MVSEHWCINLEEAPLQIFQLSTMLGAEKLALKKKLRSELAHVRFATERIEADHLKVSSESEQQLLLVVESNQITSGKQQRKSYRDELSKNSESCADDIVTVESKVEAAMPCSNKRPSRMLDGQVGKKRKMDISVMQQCSSILKKLMTHPSGWVFSQPVDPVALNIPDYFSIISKPMDLGTIKSKLQKKFYLSTQEFAADVRLTFSNAMLYNPPSNDVHLMAKELNSTFNLRWKSLEAKWSGESTKVEPQSISNKKPKKVPNARSCQKTSASSVNPLPRRLMSSAERQKLRKDLMEMTKGKIPMPLLDFLRKLRLIGQNEERIEVDIDAFDDETAWEFHRILKNCLDLRLAEVRSGGLTNHCGHDSLKKGFDKGNDTRHSCNPANVKLHMSPGACASSSCGGHNELAQASFSDIDSDRSSGRDNRTFHDGVLNPGCVTNDRANTRTSKSDPDSDGAVSTVDEENVQMISLPLTPSGVAASGEENEDPLYDGQMSPSKALRAARLKSRFADTILKAQHKTLLNHGEKADPAKMQQDRERLERKQREEKARLEAQIRAAEVESRLRAEAELKMQREREREAARIALQKMEKTVEINENQEILKDLEMFGGYSLLNQLDHEALGGVIADGFEVMLGSLEGGYHGNALERLGLFMKDDYMEEDEESVLNGDVEEGEIGS